MILEPLFAFFQAPVLVDLVDNDILANTCFIAHTVATLPVVYIVWIAAAGRHTARFYPRIDALTLEIVILVPVVGYGHAAAFEPVTLYPVDEVLEVFVFAIVGDHELQVLFDFVFHFVFVDEYEDA